jgi:hypothetical protein
MKPKIILTSFAISTLSLTLGLSAANAGNCQLVGRTPGTLKGVGLVPTLMTTEDRGIPAEIIVDCTSKGQATLVDPTAPTGITPAIPGVSVKHSFGTDRQANQGANSGAVPLIIGRNILKIHTQISSNKPLPASNNYGASIQLLLP